jgi:hypothetical protein
LFDVTLDFSGEAPSDPVFVTAGISVICNCFFRLGMAVGFFGSGIESAMECESGCRGPDVPVFLTAGESVIFDCLFRLALPLPGADTAVVARHEDAAS